MDKTNDDNPAEILRTLCDEIDNVFRLCEDARNRRLERIDFQKNYYFNVIEDAKKQNPDIVLKNLLIKIGVLTYRLPESTVNKIHDPKTKLDLYLNAFLSYLAESLEDRLKKDLYSIKSLNRCLDLLRQEYSKYLTKGEASSMRIGLKKIHDRIERNNNIEQLENNRKNLKRLLDAKNKNISELRAIVGKSYLSIVDIDSNFISSNLNSLQRTIQNYQKAVEYKQSA